VGHKGLLSEGARVQHKRYLLWAKSGYHLGRS